MQPDIAAVQAYAGKFRDAVSQAWDDSTASPRSLPRPQGAPLSYGQCSATSRLLYEQLRQAFPGINIHLATGMVWRLADGTLQSAIAHHVWLLWEQKSFANTFVIDVTADQGEGVEDAVVFGRLRDLTEKGLVYQAYSTDTDMERTELLLRVQLLRAKLDES